MSERKRTHAEIDYLNQLLDDDKKLPYELNADGTEIGSELTDEQKATKLKEEEAKLLEGKSEEEKATILAAKKGAHAAANADEELTDDKILAYLKNKKGKEITSLDDFLNPKLELTEDQKATAKQERENNKIAFGLQNNKFSTKELESYINDSKNPKDLVFAAYAKAQKENDVELTDTQIEEEFEDKFGLDQKEDSRAYKAGQLLLNNIAAKLINDKHSKILNLENDYSSFEKNTASQAEINAKIQTQSPIYKKEIEAIKNDVAKVSFKIGENVWATELPQESVDSTLSKMLSEEYVERQIKKGYTKEELTQVAQTSAIIENLPFLMQKYADEQILKKQAGSRGVLPNNGRNQKQIADGTGELTADQKKALDFYKEKFGTVGAN